MIDFYVGQKVVCINDMCGIFNQPGVPYLTEYLWPLKVGDIYTIRGIVFNIAPPWTGLNVYLNEINREFCARYQVEAPFASERFRPLIETDISVFQRMLTSIPKEEILVD